MVLAMPALHRWARATRVTWAGFLAVLAVCLLAAPSVTASPSTFEKTFRPPYTSHGGREYTNITGPSNTLAFDLTSGVLTVNKSAEVTRCHPNATRCNWGFMLFAVGGVKELKFNVSTAGSYNVSAKWRGTIWANLSVYLNGSARGTVMSNYSIITGLGICCGPNKPNQVWTSLTSSGIDQRGNRSVRVVTGVVNPHMVWLKPGTRQKYELAAYIEVFGYISVSKQAKPGASAEVSFSSPGGVELKYISVA